MVDWLLFGRDDLEERVHVFISICVIVSFYLSSDRDSVGFEELVEIVFDSAGKALLEIGLVFWAISYILAYRYAELFDEGEIGDESVELELWVVCAEGFVGFLERWASWKLLLFSLLFVEFCLRNVKIFQLFNLSWVILLESFFVQQTDYVLMRTL